VDTTDFLADFLAALVAALAQTDRRVVERQGQVGPVGLGQFAVHVDRLIASRHRAGASFRLPGRRA
jgi:hypothetical protein